MPKSRPPKKVPAVVSSWARPAWASGGKMSARASQMLARSRKRLRLAIVPGGLSGLTAPFPLPGR